MSELHNTEIWKPVHIEMYASRYSVSNLGRVRCEAAYKNHLAGRILNHVKVFGYHKVTLGNKGVRRIFAVHVLVAYAFLQKPFGVHGTGRDHLHIDHMNGKDDNRSISLQWVTQQENHRLSVIRGECKKGEESVSAKFGNKDILEIRRLRKDGWTVSRLAHHFHTSRSHIVRIYQRQSWSHI